MREPAEWPERVDADLIDQDERALSRHWYFITTEECVLCGKTRITRERRYGKKPPVGSGTTHEFIQFGCSEHFL